MDNRLIALSFAIMAIAIVAVEFIAPARPAPLVEVDAAACVEARAAPTDYNLERCYGEPF